MNETRTQPRPDECEFVGSGVADAATVSQLRRDFAAWLTQRFAIDRSRLADAVLAVYEALANAAEFAYFGAAAGGMVTLEARYDGGDNRLNVSVRDHGCWRETPSDLRDNTRGRGIPLMNALADMSNIERRPSGTTVHLQFDDVSTVDSEVLAETA